MHISEWLTCNCKPYNPCRYTTNTNKAAKRNPTGIPEIDNSNWDIYRGFGQIRVNNAINYINNNG